MKIKRVLCPGRLRQLPTHWSWVDHRLVRDDYILRCDLAALALYLFLVCVADAQGLSYYSDPSICRQLRLEPARLQQARRQLQETGLIAYEKPVYQVLELGREHVPVLAAPAVRHAADGNEEVPIAEVVRRMLGGAA
jgi:hypothetical protein